MEVIVRPRRAGKTTECVKQSAELWARIITFSRTEADRLNEMAERSNLKIPVVMSFAEYMRDVRGTDRLPIIIDNLDMILENYLSAKIYTITATGQSGVSIRSIFDTDPGAD